MGKRRSPPSPSPRTCWAETHTISSCAPAPRWIWPSTPERRSATSSGPTPTSWFTRTPSSNQTVGQPESGIVPARFLACAAFEAGLFALVVVTEHLEGATVSEDYRVLDELSLWPTRSP